ncbi:hypothetical protein AB0L49_46440 [Streptomyces antimycoticus]|uniref:hypothetical protein n=1 Tax=Streptomyces antimycoticus TaxID=68175 RepID=UPI00342ABC48
MGRKKIGKPRRPRPAQTSCTLQQLAPPGSGYEQWFSVRNGTTVADFAESPGLDGDCLDFVERITRLAIPYQREVPMAAVLLDMALDSGYLPLKQGDGATLMPLSEAGTSFKGQVLDTQDVRESIHRLHAHGALLVEEIEDSVCVRTVARRPASPGEPWVFMDEAEDDGSKACIPNAAMHDMSVEQFAVLAYLRGCMAEGVEGTPEDFATLGDWDGFGDIPQVFAEVRASSWLDHRGCSACPQGHLCTRGEADGAREC